MATALRALKKLAKHLKQERRSGNLPPLQTCNHHHPRQTQIPCTLGSAISTKHCQLFPEKVQTFHHHLGPSHVFSTHCPCSPLAWFFRPTWRYPLCLTPFATLLFSLCSYISLSPNLAIFALFLLPLAPFFPASSHPTNSPYSSNPQVYDNWPTARL